MWQCSSLGSSRELSGGGQRRYLCDFQGNSILSESLQDGAVSGISTLTVDMCKEKCPPGQNPHRVGVGVGAG